MAGVGAQKKSTRKAKPGKKKPKDAKQFQKEVALSASPDAPTNELIKLQSHYSPLVVANLILNPKFPLKNALNLSSKYFHQVERQVSSYSKIALAKKLLKQDRYSVEQKEKFSVHLNHANLALQKHIAGNLLQDIQKTGIPSANPTYSPVLVSQVFSKFHMHYPPVLINECLKPFAQLCSRVLTLTSEVAFEKNAPNRQVNQEYWNRILKKFPQSELRQIKIRYSSEYPPEIFLRLLQIRLITDSEDLMIEAIRKAKNFRPHLDKFFEYKKAEEKEEIAKKAFVEELRVHVLARKAINDFLLISPKTGSKIGKSWGEPLERIAEYVTARTKKVIPNVQIIEYLSEAGAFKYRENYRFYDPMPVQVAREGTVITDVDFKNEELLPWRSHKNGSVLNSRYGSFPMSAGPALRLHSCIAGGMNEDEIFFRKLFGARATNSIGNFTVSAAYVGITPSAYGLGGEWITVVIGLPSIASKLLNRFGWLNLEKFLKELKCKNNLDPKVVQNGFVFRTKQSQEAKEALAFLLEEVLYGCLQVEILDFEKIDILHSEVEVTRRRKIIDRLFRRRAMVNRIQRRPYLGNCSICDLPLSDPLSLSRGIGPDCWKKVTHSGVTYQDLKKDYDAYVYETPITLDLWMSNLESLVILGL